MPRYIAFLRAINVGSHIVKMDYLRKLFETMGMKNTETFIASGNVIFDSAISNKNELTEFIEESLCSVLGYQVAVFLRSTTELAKIANYTPFNEHTNNTDQNGLYIAFLTAAPGQDVQKKLYAFSTDIDEFHVYGCEVYWLCRTKFSLSSFSGALLEKTLGMQTTIRNSTTIRKLAAKFT
ncbi:MAG: DUF1697 domain-containing protein [Methanococcaceae archaeon]